MKAIAAIVILTILASAQEIPIQKLRLLPLGDPPPFRQTVRDGVRYELDAPEGALPPARLVLEGMVTAVNVPTHSLRMTLGRATADLLAPQAKVSLSLLKEDGGVWAKVSPHTSGCSLILLWKSGGSWSDVGHLALDDSQAVHADYSFHFTNVTAVKMGVILGQEKLLLDPKSTFTRIINKNTLCRIVYILPGNKVKTCFQSELSGSVGTHQRLIVYPTNSPTSRNPAKVLTMVETHTQKGTITADIR